MSDRLTINCKILEKELESHGLHMSVTFEKLLDKDLYVVHNSNIIHPIIAPDIAKALNIPDEWVDRIPLYRIVDSDFAIDMDKIDGEYCNCEGILSFPVDLKKIINGDDVIHDIESVFHDNMIRTDGLFYDIDSEMLYIRVLKYSTYERIKKVFNLKWEMCNYLYDDHYNASYNSSGWVCINTRSL